MYSESMNKYIKSDIDNATIQMKAGIMNALHDIDSREVDEIELGKYTPPTLLIECLEELGWTEDEDYDPIETNGWQIDFWLHRITPSGKRVCISGSLFYGGCKLWIYK